MRMAPVEDENERKSQRWTGWSERERLTFEVVRLPVLDGPVDDEDGEEESDGLEKVESGCEGEEWRSVRSEDEDARKRRESKDELESQRLADRPSEKNENWNDEECDLDGGSDGDGEGEVDPAEKRDERMS